jgi:hypothetical protein
MALERIRQMLALCSAEKPLFPPTDLYNEGWMLRLVLDWFSSQTKREHPPLSPLDGGIAVDVPLDGGIRNGDCLLEGGIVKSVSRLKGEMEEGIIPQNEKWYSEALLPSAFLPRYRGDQYAESWTHADGVIGDFKIGENGTGDLSLLPDARHLIVLEAKMFSKLSPGVTHAKYYNQAARTVACIAEVLRRANQNPSVFQRLSFFVIAPEWQIDDGVFEPHMTHESILKIVQRRVNEYDESREVWFQEWFLPTMDRITIDVLSWEELLDYISRRDSTSGEQLNVFYAFCLKFNRRNIKT